VTVDNSNRHRISTNFRVVKLLLVVGLFLMPFNLIINFNNGAFTSKSIIGLTLGTLVLTGIFYYVNTRKRIDYDDIKQILYIVDIKKKTETEIPVEKIDKILYSAIGGRGQKSYIIAYRDFHNQKKEVRLFPILFDNSIETIIIDTKLKNPALITRRWSFG